MKNVITLLCCAVAILMTSCARSNEEKAENLIKDLLKGYLHYPESYEPITTRVDSMTIDPNMIKPIMRAGHEIYKLTEKKD